MQTLIESVSNIVDVYCRAQYFCNAHNYMTCNIIWNCEVAIQTFETYDDKMEQIHL